MKEQTSTTSIVVCGVGGQGVVFAGEVVALAGIEAGLDVKKSDALGMAQRGGSVESHVRMGAVVASPVVEVGTADFLVALEVMDAVRCSRYLAVDGQALVSTREVMPPGLERNACPTDLRLRVTESTPGRPLWVPTKDLCAKLRAPKAANCLMLGVLSCLMSVPLSCWREAFGQQTRTKLTATNWQAFELGRLFFAEQQELRQAPTTAAEMLQEPNQ